MTYRELVARLATFNDIQLDSDLTVHVGDEFWPAELKINPETDVLDAGYPYLEVQ